MLIVGEFVVLKKIRSKFQRLPFTVVLSPIIYYIVQIYCLITHDGGLWIETDCEKEKT